jgi:siroheme synthase-like protein
VNFDSHTPSYPAFLDLRGRLVVIVGGDLAAERAVFELLEYGPDVVVIAPEVSPALDRLVAEGRIENEPRSYVRGDLGGAFLVVSTSDSLETNRAVYQEAESLGCLVSVVGDPELSNFATPAEEIMRGITLESDGAGHGSE